MDKTTQMRVTVHNGRAGQNGVYSPKHNDRQFNIDHATHIDNSRTNYNFYYHIFEDNIYKFYTFEQAEKQFYEDCFSAALEAKNRRYIDQRHPERVKSMDEIRSMQRYCPSESILQIGKLGGTVSPAELNAVCEEYLHWHEETYPNVIVLNAALHADEQGAPHMHVRCAWIGHDAYGNLTPNQSGALAEMGIQRPDPSKPKSRYNSPIMTYTQQTREQFISICRAHGLQIETQPQHASRTGLSQLDYQAQQATQRARAAEADCRATKQQAQILQQLVTNKTSAVIKQSNRLLQDMQSKDILQPTKITPPREEKCLLGHTTQQAEPRYFCYTDEQIDNIRQALDELENLKHKYSYYQSLTQELTQSINKITADSARSRDNSISQIVDDALKPAQADVRRLQEKINSLVDSHYELQKSADWNKRIVDRMSSDTYDKTIKIIKMEDAYSNRRENSITGYCYVKWQKDPKSPDEMHITEFLELYKSTCKHAKVKPQNIMMQHLDKMHQIERQRYNDYTICR